MAKGLKFGCLHCGQLVEIVDDPVKRPGYFVLLTYCENCGFWWENIVNVKRIKQLDGVKNV